MCTIILKSFFPFVAQANANGLIAKQSGETQHLIANCVDNLAKIFFHEAREGPFFWGVDLDSASPWKLFHLAISVLHRALTTLYILSGNCPDTERRFATAFQSSFDRVPRAGRKPTRAMGSDGPRDGSDDSSEDIQKMMGEMMVSTDETPESPTQSKWLDTKTPALPPITSFSALAGQPTRNGQPIPTYLVEACLTASDVKPSTAKPTAVQAQVWQLLLSPSPPDLVAIAPTGSGKTLAFLLPLFSDLLWLGSDHQRNVCDESLVECTKVASPAALILVPTRELCQQTADLAHRIQDQLVKRERDRVCHNASNTSTIGIRAQDLATKLSTLCIAGGVDYHRQRSHLSASDPELIVATPGRLVALCGEVSASTRARQKARLAKGEPAQKWESEMSLPPVCTLGRVRFLVLDEADRLLSMGFEKDLAVLQRMLPSGGGRDAHDRLAAEDVGRGGGNVHGARLSLLRPWTLFFSATWTAGTTALAAAYTMKSAAHIHIPANDRKASTTGIAGVDQELAVVSTVIQRVVRIRVLASRTKQLLQLLRNILTAGAIQKEQQEGGRDEGEDGTGSDNIEGEEVKDRGNSDDTNFASAPIDSLALEAARVIVFCVYKKEVKDIAKLLVARGFPAVPLQGDMSQKARSLAIEDFRAGRARVLVATDVGARGLDVKGVSHVINLSLGTGIEQYVHRAGRCGRAGKVGEAHTFVLDGDKHLAPELVHVLQRGKQHVPEWLTEMARDARVKREKAAKQIPNVDPEEIERRRVNRENQLKRAQDKRKKEHAQPLRRR